MPGFAAAALAAVLLAAGCSTAQRPEPGGSGEERRHPAAQRGERPPAGKPSQRPRPGDVNGDGYDDFVAVVAGGSLVVVYGSAKGLGPHRHTVVPGP